MTDVSQSGVPVEWAQSEGVLLVIGGLTLNGQTPTDVAYELGEAPGLCEIRSDGSSCSLEN